MALTDVVLARLKGQVSRAQLVLFTGAGFSRDARDRSGQPIPGVLELRKVLHDILFPGRPFDQDASLGELYGLALRRDRTALRAVLESRFSVDPASLPDYYRTYFTFPWRRIYTLNVDDLEGAASRRFSLPRSLRLLSAVNPSREPRPQKEGAPELDVVHLNGGLDDGPELLTFSESQYGERLASRDSWYERCVVDLRSRPVVFVGTELRESTLWQHLSLRERHVGSSEVTPPGSILVTPTLSAVREETLASLNVDWFKGTAAEFEALVLRPLGEQASKGLSFLSMYTADSGRKGVPLVSELAAEHPNLATEYLLGDEPDWSDFVSGRVAIRPSLANLRRVADGLLSGSGSTALVVTGTAGSGKSTALMWLALELSNRGLPVFWIDRDSAAGPSEIRKKIAAMPEKSVLAIDDADLFGGQLLSMLRDLVPHRPGFLFVCAMRANKVDEFSGAIARTRELSLIEYVVPPLTDEDIDALIGVLDRHNRLGILKGEPADARRRAFAERAGRQLLVAMIEATSSEKFELKATTELDGLQPPQWFIYALLVIASSQRHFLTKDEVLLAASDVADPADALNRLVSRHLVVARPPNYEYRVRHRVIADVVLDHLREQHQLKPSFIALAYALASKIEPDTDRYGRMWRLLIRLLNHEMLQRTIGIMAARELYQEVEDLLARDYHYWLQRGSLEVEAGDLRRAEHFLDQARSLSPGDHRVDTEYGYLLMRKAVDNVGSTRAPDWLDEGTRLLEGVIAARNGGDYHPFHIIGSQGLAWVRHGVSDPNEKRRLLSYYFDFVEEGRRLHPLRRDLDQLSTDMRRDLLMTTVRDPPKS